MRSFCRSAPLALLVALSGCAVQQFDPSYFQGGDDDAGATADAVAKDVPPLEFDVVTEPDVPVTPPEDTGTPAEDVVTPPEDTGTPAEDVVTPPVDTGACPFGQSLCRGACVNPLTDPAHCGACDNACAGGMRCTSGRCACGIAQTLCGGACVLTSTDVMNCGACGRACAAGQSCVAGACMVVCPSGQTACGGACVSTQTDGMNCGACGNACTMGATCMAGRCVGGTITGPSFQLNALQTSGCRVVEHESFTGDDRGGIAVSNSQVFYTGDNATARFNLETLAAANIGRIYDAMVSNLRSGTVYVLANGTTPLTQSGGMATALIEVDGNTGAPTTRSVALGNPIAMPASARVGIFSGWDRAVILAGGRAYHITLPSGAVMDLGAVAFPSASACENWAIWGVAEFFNGALWVDYVQSSTVIARTRLPDGMTAPLSRFTNLSDMCSFTVQPTLRRWYFHHEGTSQFAGAAETLGYCDAQVVADGLMCPTGQSDCGGFCRNLQTDATHCGACGTACPTGQVCAAGVCGCPAGQSLCGSVCVPTQTDRNNCGACGNACPTGQACLAGRCTAATNYTAGPAPSDVVWTNVCTQQRTLISVDDASELVTLPFDFPYWGTTIAAGSRINISSNGFISLAPSSSSSLSGSIPSTLTPNSTLAAQWGDLETGSSGICYGTVGTAPSRRFIVQWSGASNFGGTGSLNFQIALHEASGAIDFVYGTMSSAQSRTVGIENPAGTMAVGGCGTSTTCTISSNTRIRFTPGS